MKKLYLCFFILILIVCAGCDDEEGLLDQYAGKRLGVILEADDQWLAADLSSTLIEYIKWHVDMEVVNPELLRARNVGTPNSEDVSVESVNHSSWEDLGLDLLLTVKMSNPQFKEAEPDLSIRPKRFSMKITYYCSLTLSYTLENLHTGEIINLGQSKGHSEESTKIKAGKGGFDMKFEEIDRYELIEDAMLNALRKTKLL